MTRDFRSLGVDFHRIIILCSISQSLVSQMLSSGTDNVVSQLIKYLHISFNRVREESDSILSMSIVLHVREYSRWHTDRFIRKQCRSPYIVLSVCIYTVYSVTVYSNNRIVYNTTIVASRSQSVKHSVSTQQQQQPQQQTSREGDPIEPELCFKGKTYANDLISVLCCSILRIFECIQLWDMHLWVFQSNIICSINYQFIWILFL